MGMSIATTATWSRTTDSSTSWAIVGENSPWTSSPDQAIPAQPLGHASTPSTHSGVDMHSASSRHARSAPGRTLPAGGIDARAASVRELAGIAGAKASACPLTRHSAQACHTPKMPGEPKRVQPSRDALRDNRT